MNQRTVLKGMQISRDIPYRDPSALFALVGTDGNGKNAYLPVGEELLSRHLLLLGDEGTGKTNLLLHLFRNLRAHLGESDALIVFDPTGEYQRLFFQPGDTVLASDARASGPDGDADWNLFLELEKGDGLAQQAQMLSSLLILGDAFEERAARDLLTALLMYLRKGEDASLQNNAALRELIEGFDVDGMNAILDSMPEFRGMSAYLSDPDSTRTLSVIAVLQAAARDRLCGRFGQIGTLSIRDFVAKRGGKALFICCDPQRQQALAPVYGAMLESALYQSLEENGKEGALYLLLDDLRLLPRLPRLENTLRLGRTKGVRVIACASGVAPLRQAYGETGAQGLLTAFDTTVAFRLHDRETRDVVKSLYGRHRVVESYSSVLPQHALIEQAMDQYVIEDEDLTALQTGESLVCALHYPPFWFRVKR